MKSKSLFKCGGMGVLRAVNWKCEWTFQICGNKVRAVGYRYAKVIVRTVFWKWWIEVAWYRAYQDLRIPTLGCSCHNGMAGKYVGMIRVSVEKE